MVALRMETKDGPDRIGPQLGLHPSTVHRILRRHGVHRLSHLFPKPPRSFGSYPALRPGELVGLDIKSFGSLQRGGGRRGPLHSKAGGGVGWKHLHVAIDMASRLVFTEFRSTLGGRDGAAFLDRAMTFFASQGIRVERVLSDNGAAYKSFVFRDACAAAGIRHTRIKPRHPWTNGRAERFIGTIQRECAYRDQFTSDPERALAIALFDTAGAKRGEQLFVLEDKSAELRFEPFDCGEIEVVGRLVEQQDVGFADQHVGQRRAPRFAAGDGGRIFFAGQAEVVQQRARPVAVVQRP